MYFMQMNFECLFDFYTARYELILRGIHDNLIIIQVANLLISITILTDNFSQVCRMNIK